MLAAVAAGGALGAVGRWSLGEVTPAAIGFPWTTFAINVCGSLLLAALPALVVVRRHRLVALFLGPGLLGGFTTLSAYADDARDLIADGRTWLAGAYLLGTLSACLVAVHAGRLLSTPGDQRAFDDEEGNE